MSSISWSAALAALLAVTALILAAFDLRESIVVALASITFALLSHRDT